MDGGENRGFKASFTGEGQAMLKVRVKEKLKELMGDYSDDTLAEYATVLIRNGRSRDEFAKELHVFLGDDNDAFVSWLWDHLSSNSHLYFQPTKAVASSDGAKSTRSAAGGLPVSSLNSSMQTNHEPEAETQKTTKTRQRREWGGMVREQPEPVTLRSVVANVSYAEEPFHDSHAEDKRLHKSHAARRVRSPDRRNQRKRNREDDERSTKRASLPVIDAPRRLLQFAVRDAVRPVQPMLSRSESASKRLRSVVSTMSSDSTVNTHIRLRRASTDLRVPGAARALRAAAEAAEDIRKENLSGSVFNRIGVLPTRNSTERSLLHRERDPYEEEYENIDRSRPKNQAEYHSGNEYGGGDGYMYDREAEEAAGSAPIIDEYDNNRAIRSNGLMSRPSTLPSGGGKESLVVGYVQGAAEVRSKRSIVQGTNDGSGPRPSEMILNASANTTTCHDSRNAATFALQVPAEKKSSDARKSNVTISHVNDVTMTDKTKDSIHSSSMVEAQKASSVAVGSGSTGEPEGVNGSRTVFVSNVHFGASKDALSRHFNKFGAVLKTLIVTDGVTGQPTGTAYIEFLHKESAEQALVLNGTSFMSRILKVVRRSSIEVPQQPIWPRASRGSPFASRLIRTAYPRPTFPGAMRGRLPLRGGTRSMQWKREDADSTDAGKSSQGTSAAPGNPLVTPIARSFTYTRTEPKPNDGAMV